MSRLNEYLMPQEVVALLEMSKLSLHALRVFHACYAYVDRMPLLSVEIVAMTGKPGCTALCSELAGITGPASGKSIDWIRRAIPEFDGSELFSQLVTDENGSCLTFKFSSKVAKASMRRSKSAPFAMLDSDKVAAISSAAELLFFTRAVMLERCDHHSFYLPHIDPELAPWTDNSKKSWMRVAARVGERLQQEYLILPERDPLSRTIVRVKVKVVSQNSKWTPECLFPRRSRAGVSIVHEGRFRSLTKTELFDRRMWTRVTAP